MMSEGKNLSEKLKTNMIQYLYSFFEGDQVLIFSQINKKFKKCFLDLLLSNPDYEISYTINEGTKLNDLFMRIHLTELVFKNCEITSKSLAELEKKCKVKQIKKLRVEGCRFSSKSDLKKFTSLDFMSFISKEYMHLTSLIVTGQEIEPFILDFSVFLNMVNLRHLSLTNLFLKTNSLAAFNDFLYLKNLESLDVTNSNIGIGFISTLCFSISSFPNLKNLNFSNNNLDTSYVIEIIERLGNSNKKLNVNLSENFIENPNSLMNKYTNLSLNLSNQKVKKRRTERTMRMLFSRSGEVIESSSKYHIEKRMGIKNNGAILPLYIYPNTSLISFSKDELKRILKIENSIRLSLESKLLYDKFKYSSLEHHIQLDKEIIQQALKSSGYNPEEDDSLKAYHLATSVYINDDEVRNEVVWMKYDKCKVGNFHIGDKALIQNINLYTLSGDIKLFNQLISSIKPNVIVCGSLS